MCSQVTPNVFRKTISSIEWTALITEENTLPLVDELYQRNHFCFRSVTSVQRKGISLESLRGLVFMIQDKTGIWLWRITNSGPGRTSI